MKTKSRGRARGLPVAAMATYGPDDTRGTKLVVSIFRRPGDRRQLAVKIWTTEASDVRSDPSVTADVAAFLSEYQVRRTVDAGRIIGCPHEEGIDYPMGRTCPRCPFWAGIDRFTHKPLQASEPALSADEVLQTIAADPREVPEEALASADAHREALVEPLLNALERGIANPGSASSVEAALFSYALYLLAKWREPQAYPYVVRWLSLPEEEPFEIAGDIVVQDGARILASVCDGNLEPITSLIMNREADEWGRSAGVTALTLLAAWAEIPRRLVIDRLLDLARQGLEREPTAAWDSLAFSSADIEAIEVFPELRRAYDEGLIDSQCVGQSELDDVEAMPRGEMIERTRERWPPIDDVAEATAWWDRGSPDRGDEDRDDAFEGDDWEGDGGAYAESAEPYRAPPKVGRNEPCRCGSGKKFKKCCGK